RAVMFLAYAGCGAAILIYNLNSTGDGVVYLAGLLLIATAIFPHRSFLHSTEGLVLYSICAFYLAGKLGYAYLGNAFFLGYASHLYLADMFTKEGIPLSVIPMILKKAGVHKVLKKYTLYRAVYGVLDIRLRLPLSSTGSKSGDRLEGAYVLLLLIACAAAFLISGAGISIAIL
ncbi:LexA-binding, inner membrane-associated putative hydrolase, partial [Anaerobacterium chartisolvens]